jgi:Mg2+ and Co2+ transporter CorA
MAACKANLWRLIEAIKALGHASAADAELIHQDVLALRESAGSLMNLHMNVSNYDMNNMIRVLTLVSALGLIPTTVGGLLGMNLIDNPWPVTLGQVAFGIGVAMLLCLYTFAVQGWIRTAAHK